MGVTGHAYRIFVDGKVVKDLYDSRDGWDQQVTVDNLSAGPHDIKVEYRNEADNFKFSLSWAQPEANIEEAVEVAKKADAVVVVVGTSNDSEGESIDRKSIYLPGDQDDLIVAVAKANPRTTVVLNTGGPVLMDKWRDKVPAIMQAFFPGQEGGTAIAEIVSGKVNPSGKLPISMPKKLSDSPSDAYYHGQEDFIDYSKVGVLEGYRGYDAKKIEPEFAFGHGLSYTNFKYSDLKVEGLSADTRNPKVKVTMKLTNSGKKAGAEVVQLYVGEESPEVERAPKELKGFEKISLQPGESKNITFTLDAEAFRYWNDQTHSWTVKPGKFDILLASSSRDIRLKGQVNIQGSKTVSLEKCAGELATLQRQRSMMSQKLNEFSSAAWFVEIRSRLNIQVGEEKELQPISAETCGEELTKIKDELENMRTVTREFAKKFDARLFKVEAEAAEAKGAQ
jgi:beta-glucosidase